MAFLLRRYVIYPYVTSSKQTQFAREKVKLSCPKVLSPTWYRVSTYREYCIDAHQVRDDMIPVGVPLIHTKPDEAPVYLVFVYLRVTNQRPPSIKSRRRCNGPPCSSHTKTKTALESRLVGGVKQTSHSYNTSTYIFHCGTAQHAFLLLFSFQFHSMNHIFCLSRFCSVLSIVAT